jgi:hypothetical protein
MSRLISKDLQGVPSHLMVIGKHHPAKQQAVGGVLHQHLLTQREYDALPFKDPIVNYFIIDRPPTTEQERARAIYDHYKEGS